MVDHLFQKVQTCTGNGMVEAEKSRGRCNRLHPFMICEHYGLSDEKIIPTDLKELAKAFLARVELSNGCRIFMLADLQ